VSAAIIVPTVFAAELPTPEGLGLVEGLLDSCSQMNPKSAAVLKKQRERLIQGVSEKDLAKLRASDKYKDTYKSIGDQLEKVSKDEAAEACKVLLGDK
jgi:hypothetical protein